MTKYSNDYLGNHIVEIDDTDYLVQGNINDELTMFRPVSELLECERDNVNKILGEME